MSARPVGQFSVVTPAEQLGPVRLAGTAITAAQHACAFFSSTDEEYESLLAFIKDGIDAGESAFHTIDPERAADHARRLAEAEIDVGACCGSRQLELKTWNEVHLRGGRFDPHATSSLFVQARADAQERGFSRTRFVSHMGWAAQRLTKDQLLEYEALANYALDPSIFSVCVYDLSAFNAGLVIDVMRTHPWVLIGGVLYDNPLFVLPDELLRELRERKLSQHRSREA